MTQQPDPPAARPRGRLTRRAAGASALPGYPVPGPPVIAW
jgi:hypothetical protein